MTESFKFFQLFNYYTWNKTHQIDINITLLSKMQIGYICGSIYLSSLFCFLYVFVSYMYSVSYVPLKQFTHNPNYQIKRIVPSHFIFLFLNVNIYNYYPMSLSVYF